MFHLLRGRRFLELREIIPGTGKPLPTLDVSRLGVHTKLPLTGPHPQPEELLHQRSDTEDSGWYDTPVGGE